MFFDMQLGIQEKKKLRLRFRKDTVKHDEAYITLLKYPRRCLLGLVVLKSAENSRLRCFEPVEWIWNSIFVALLSNCNLLLSVISPAEIDGLFFSTQVGIESESAFAVGHVQIYPNMCNFVPNIKNRFKVGRWF